VVAGLLPTANLAIDIRGDETAGERRTEQEMIDPEAGVACE